jgi:hypothetical protein
VSLRIREEGVTPACSRKSLVRDNIADSDELWPPLLCMVRYRASFRKVAHYRVRLLRDLVDELSDWGQRVTFEIVWRSILELFGSGSILMKRGRELSNRTHRSALIATSSVMAPLFAPSKQQRLPLFCQQHGSFTKSEPEPQIMSKTTPISLSGASIAVSILRTVDSVLYIDILLQMCFTVGGAQGRSPPVLRGRPLRGPHYGGSP